MLKAIYKTVESVEVFPEINVETVNEKLYLLSSLIDLGHSINLNIHIDKKTISRLVRKTNSPQTETNKGQCFTDYLRHNNRNFSIRSVIGRESIENSIQCL